MKLLLTTILFASFFLGACSVNKRDAETPAPTVKQFKTDFFFEYSADRKTYKPRRFLFGMMTEDKAGQYRDINFDHYNRYGSANIEFDFNESGDQLIGRLVNPTYPNNKEKWQVFLSFEISKNYYKESAVDATGRTSNDQIERDDKSDPRARPYINLELSSLSFKNELDLGEEGNIIKKVIQKVEDIDKSEDGKFLGFTTVSTNAGVGSHAQTIDRVNLLRMEKSPSDFEETPYNSDNAEHIQILHIVSSLPNHFGENLKAVHWDINSKTKKKYTIHLHNFPDEYLKVGKDSVESWNDVFQDVVGYRPFETAVWKNKYSFDLRHHVVHWVDDVRLSAAGPLGVANVAADLETGRVLWTGSIIWGGLLDRYAGRNVPSFNIAGMSQYSRPHDLSHTIPKNKAIWNTPLVTPDSGSYEGEFSNYLNLSITEINNTHIQELVEAHHLGIDDQLKKEEIDLATANNLKAAYVAELRSRTDLTSISGLEFHLNKARNMNPVNDVNLDDGLLSLKENPLSLNEIMNQLNLNQPGGDESNPFYLGAVVDSEGDFYKNLPDDIKNNAMQLPDGFFENIHDTENSAFEALNSLNAGINKLISDGELLDIEDVKRGMIKNTLIHEIGHTLGLGHNFKSNIMPEKGSVPNAIFNALEEKAKEKRTDSAGKEKEKMINFSSIMGYPDGFTEALKDYKDHKPGFNDISRIRYLYKQEYPMYDKTTDGKSDYQWTKLKVDGRIYPQLTVGGKKLTPGYLPNCNDIEASFYADPYCNRHDRGYNAQTLIDGYFDRYWDALAQNLESSIDSLKTRNFFGIESYLWGLSARTFNRARLFHDYMRNKYKKEIAALNGKNLETTSNLLNFSQNCKDLSKSSSSELKSLSDSSQFSPFIEKRSDGKYKINEFGDLCIATAKYFDKTLEILQLEGKEYTEIDYFNSRSGSSILSGDSRNDYSQFYGSWKRISLMPIKYKIMQNILLPYPTMTLGGRDYPQFIYTRADTSFSMSTLYPKEFLSVVRNLVENSMSFDDQTAQPSISLSLYYLGYFLRFQNQTRDYKIFPSEILDSVSSLNQFRFSNALIEVEATKEDGSQHAKSFKGNIYNQFNSSGKETLGNIYLYTHSRLVMNAQNNSIALQTSPVRWRSPSNGVAYAIKLDYAPNFNFEELEAYSPRKYFIDNYHDTLKKCVKGDNANQDNGLESYFNSNNEKFEGILIPFNIDSRSSGYKDINDSILLNLYAFAKDKDFDLRSCESALKTQKTLVLGAALMMGYVFEDTLKSLEMGAN